MKRIILFGASSMGEIAYKELQKEYNIVYFTDNDKKRWGNKLLNTEIIPPNDLINIKNDFEIIITSQYDVIIAEQLIRLGIRRFGVLRHDLKYIDYFDYSDIDNINKKGNKITLITNNNSGSNTALLYKMIPNDITDKYEVVLVEANNKNNNFYLDLLESRLVVHAHSNQFNDTQINVQLWHGFPLKTLSYMSKFPDSVKMQNNIQWNKLEAVTSYSQTYSTIVNACFGLNGSKYVITGMPRNDFIFISNGKKKLSNLLDINLKDKKIIFYMPTFRESKYGLETGNKNKFSILDFDDFNIQELDGFLESINAIMFFKLHPFHKEEATTYIEKEKVKNIYALEDVKLKENNLDLYEIINGIDILITDYSSIYFDYLLLDRPIIFTPLDLAEYRENVGFLLEPYSFWAPGPKCYGFKDLKNKIKKCLTKKDYYKKERKVICDIVHQYKDSNSSQRVWKLVDDLMSSDIGKYR